MTVPPRRIADLPPSPREATVVRCIATGMRNRQIAEYMQISIKTVEKHRSNVMVKIGAHGTAQITSWWMRQQKLNEPHCVTCTCKGAAHVHV